MDTGYSKTRIRHQRGSHGRSSPVPGTAAHRSPSMGFARFFVQAPRIIVQARTAWPLPTTSLRRRTSAGDASTKVRIVEDVNATQGSTGIAGAPSSFRRTHPGYRRGGARLPPPRNDSSSPSAAAAVPFVGHRVWAARPRSARLSGALGNPGPQLRRAQGGQLLASLQGALGAPGGFAHEGIEPG